MVGNFTVGIFIYGIDGSFGIDGDGRLIVGILGILGMDGVGMFT